VLPAISIHCTFVKRQTRAILTFITFIHSFIQQPQQGDAHKSSHLRTHLIISSTCPINNGVLILSFVDSINHFVAVRSLSINHNVIQTSNAGHYCSQPRSFRPIQPTTISSHYTTHLYYIITNGLQFISTLSVTTSVNRSIDRCAFLFLSSTDYYSQQSFFFC
jgi:hypothetical protein